MNTLRTSLVLLMLCITLGSCLKKSYDTPPDTAQYDPNLPVNLTIGQLSQMALNMNIGSFRTLGDSTIEGVVNADDRTGNFYKQIVIQDSTGGMTICLAQYDLYSDYPVGRKVYIKLNGLTLVNYNGLPEVCFSASVSSGKTTAVGVPISLIPTYVIKASYPNPVIPQVVKIVDVLTNSNKYLNMLVQFNDVEFATGSDSVVYSFPNSSTSRTISDCPYTASLVMYNSSYATFAPFLTPSGKGTLTCVYSVYNTPQLLIRDTTDFVVTGNRTCP